MPLLALCALVLGIALIPGGLPSAGFGWDFLNGSGFCLLAIIAFLGWDSESPAGNPRLRLHRNLALVAALLGGIHAVGYLLVDATVVEYLLPTAPAYMLVGVAALVCLWLATLSSMSGSRKAVYPNFASFRRWHRGLFTVILLGSGWHVLGTEFTVQRAWQAALLILLLGAFPAVAYLSRRTGRQLPLSKAPQSNIAADRTTCLIALGLALAAVGFAALKTLACDAC